MKLIRLKILDAQGFRSLPKGFETYFLRDFDYDKATDFNPYILAGRNGSGKSNVLEALAEIFYHLDCIYLSNKPDYFDKFKENPKGFNPSVSIINAYELEYFTFLNEEQFPDCDLNQKVKISIRKKKGERPTITWENEGEFRKPKPLSQAETKSLLPEYVIGYASGHNQTLSIPFFKSRFLQYDEYIQSLDTQEFVEPKPEASLVYLDESFSQAILLSNLLMNDTGSDNGILSPFKQYVQLRDVDSFRIIIRTNAKATIPKEVNFFEGEPRIITHSKETNILNSIDQKTSKESVFVRSYIEKLKRCATSWNEVFNYDVPRDDNDEEEFFDDSSYLTLDYNVNKGTKDAFQFHFENNPLKLFELFQLLIVLDNYEVSIKEKQRAYTSKNIFIVNDIHQRPKEADRILRFKDFYIKKQGVKKSIFTKSLSDGEHQFLHTLGLCLLFKDTRSLFLLDEPETHFNPDWKAKYISSVRNSFKKEEKDSSETMREMLITTHSPFLISDSKMEYVLVFRKNPKSQKVDEPKRPDFQTFGTSINKIGIRLFEMPNTIGEFAQKRLDEFRENISNTRSNREKEELIKQIKNELGESVERALLIHEITESQNPDKA